MEKANLTRQEFAKKIVGLREIRFEVEQAKLQAKQAERDEDQDFKQCLANFEKNYDEYKSKLTQVIVSDDEELQKIKASLDQDWHNLQDSLQQLVDFSS